MMPTYLKRVKDTIIFNDDGEMVYYVPEKYFNGKNAVVVGEYVDVMGIFNYDVFSKTGKSIGGLRQFNYPAIFRCKPTKITKVKDFTFKNTNSEPADYRILSFKKDAEVISSVKIPRKVAYAENFIDLLIRGNLPNTVPYDELQNYIIKNANISGFNYGISAQIFGLVISELCRDPNNLTNPFRLSKMQSMTDYKSLSIEKVPKFISPYTAITSQNPDECISASINATKNDKHKPSPLEKVMMN